MITYTSTNVCRVTFTHSRVLKIYIQFYRFYGMKVNELVKYLVKWQLSHMESTRQNILIPNSDKKKIRLSNILFLFYQNFISFFVLLSFVFYFGETGYFKFQVAV